MVCGAASGGGAKPIASDERGGAIFGELVQMDGSFEDWLEQRGRLGCLINIVDDATSKGLAHFDAEETTWAVADRCAVGGEIRHSTGAVRGLEERLSPRADPAAGEERRSTGVGVSKHVPEVGNRTD